MSSWAAAGSILEQWLIETGIFLVIGWFILWRPARRSKNVGWRRP